MITSLVLAAALCGGCEGGKCDKPRFIRREVIVRKEVVKVVGNLFKRVLLRNR